MKLDDRALGIRTARKHRPGDLAGPSAPFASDYQPTPYAVFEDLMIGVELTPPTSFVDLGAGKGRVVCLAARRPFARVIGVELSAALCAEARANLAALGGVRARAVEIVEADAARFRLPSGPTVLFLYNPFGAEVLAAVAARLAPPITVLYYEPVHLDVLLRAAPFIPSRLEPDRAVLRWGDAGRAQPA